MGVLSTELDVDAVLGSDGLIKQEIVDFRPRQSQLEMSRLIHSGIAKGESHLIEASTGIGKTFAYLVPVFLSKKKVVISTGTKNLQDQLFYKDIPLIKRIVVNSKKTALLKGRSNYCCPYRVELFSHQKQSQSREMSSLFTALQEWSETSKTGDISEFSAIPENDPLWFFATSTADNCLGNECPSLDDCFVVKARKKAMEADVVVINHHLYFSDQALKKDGFGEILPEAQVVIFDEAHQLPDIASLFYGNQLTMRQIEMMCKDIIAAELAEAADSNLLKPACEALSQAVADFRLAMGQFPEKAEWMRIQNAPPMQKAVKAVQAEFKALKQSLEPLTGRGKELASCSKRLESVDWVFKQFLCLDDQNVSWYEWSDRSFRLMVSPLDVSDLFRQQLDESLNESVFFTSATLSSQQSFKYYADRLGLSDINTSLFESPFNYPKQALLYLPKQLPDPSDSNYAKLFGELCCDLIEATNGYCFILFTSYRMLTWTASYLRSKIKNKLFVQGDYQRSELLQQYMKAKSPVLLGTSSFWEGVDVKGDQLRCVIIDKLPFKSPQDPVYKKRLQLANQDGGNAFMNVQIPEATINLRQGVGRLIRDIEDKGIVALCDNRLVSKSYGKKMLDSLPAMKQTTSMADVTAFAKKAFPKPTRKKMSTQVNG
jgi:ATP-dependent DNA helicase DinG